MPTSFLMFDPLSMFLLYNIIISKFVIMVMLRKESRWLCYNFKYEELKQKSFLLFERRFNVSGRL